MGKGYLVARVRIHNKSDFNKFIEITKALVVEYEEKVLVRNPEPEIKEGNLKGLTTIIEFKSVTQVRKFYNSNTYTNAKVSQEKASETDLILVEGV